MSAAEIVLHQNVIGLVAAVIWIMAMLLAAGVSRNNQIIKEVERL